MMKFRYLGPVLAAASIGLTAPAMAQSTMAPAGDAQPVGGGVMGFDPHGGSGPDTSRTNIVSPKEQQRQMDAIRQQRAAAQSQATPTQMQPTPTQAAVTGQSPATTANGLTLRPDGGSGLDKTKFNIVSKKEAQQQQGQMQRSGGNGMTSDGTGGGENSSGN